MIDYPNLNILVLLLILGGGIFLLFAGGEALTRGSVSLALKLKISKLIVGLTIVSIATSTPELITSVNGALLGYHDIAVGNIIGSNIANIGFILGLSAVICPMYIKRGMLFSEVPMLIFSTLLLSVMCFYFAPSGHYLTRTEGFILLALALAYLTYFVRLAMRQRAKIFTKTVERECEEEETMKEYSALLTFAFIAAGVGVLYWGSNLVLDSSVELAKRVGLSEAFIGISIVAVGTSLPELAASVIAAVKKQPDIAIGNVIGSNIFNVLLIGGISASITPMKVSEHFIKFDIYALCFITLLLCAVFISGLRLGRRKGIALLASYAVILILSAFNSA